MPEEVQHGNTASSRSAAGKKILLEILSVSFLLILYAIIVSFSTFQKSAVFDEPFHITGGYNYLKNGDLKMCSEGGYLTEALLALPLMPEKINFPYKGKSFFSDADEWESTRDFLFRSGNDADSMILASRCVVLFATAMLALIVYLVSRGIFGIPGGIISLILLVSCPDFLAHGGLATTDMTSTLAFIITIWSLWRLVNKITPASLAFASICLGLLFIAKHSALMIVPFYLTIILIRLFSGKPLIVKGFGKILELKTQKSQIIALAGTSAVNVIIIIFMIWGACGFRYSMLKDDLGKDREVLNQTIDSFLNQGGALGKVVSIAKETRILPEAYVYGYAFFIKFGKSRYAFLDGEYNPSGWWYFFPFTFLYKTSIPFILLLVISIFILAKGRGSLNNPLASLNSDKIYQLVPFAVFTVIYILFAMTSRTNIGHRHLLPVYPSLFIIAGSLSIMLMHGRKIAKFAIIFLLTWAIAEAAFAFPNYISYFNQFAGGQKNAYKHLVDSSLDWGQELKSLKEWLGGNNKENKNVYLSFFGNADVSYYGLDVKILPSYRKQKSDEAFELQDGIYCFSATMFQLVYLAESCYYDTGFDLSDADDNYFSMLSKEIKDLPLPCNIASLTEEQRKKYRIYEYIRLMKVRAHLHNRTPDEIIGGSILVFRLNKEDIEKVMLD